MFCIICIIQKIRLLSKLIAKITIEVKTQLWHLVVEMITRPHPPIVIPSSRYSLLELHILTFNFVFLIRYPNLANHWFHVFADCAILDSSSNLIDEKLVGRGIWTESSLCHQSFNKRIFDFYWCFRRRCLWKVILAIKY